MKPDALPPEALAVAFDRKALGFETTDDVARDEDHFVLGQERAMEAIRFGTRIRHDGYNLFLVGPEGTGRHSILRQAIEQQAVAEAAPNDWVYVNNFSVPYKPKALAMPRGRGNELAKAMERLIDDAKASVPSFFENEENQRRIQAVQQEFQQRQQEAFEALRERANEKNIALVRTPMGFAFVPLLGKEVMRPENFEQLPEDQKTAIQGEIEKLEEELKEIVKQVPAWDRERREALRQLTREITSFAVGGLIDQLRGQFDDIEVVAAHLDALREDMIEHFHDLFAAEHATASEGNSGPVTFQASGFERYKANPIVSSDDSEKGAPIVYEDNPTLANLVGRVDHVSRFGTLIADFSLIKPGALHRANGGYLILDARKVLSEPFAWEALKRALKAECIVIESPAQFLSFVSTMSLEPEPIPLNVKIAMLGDRRLYHLLSVLDPEFNDLFKVLVDFEVTVERAPEIEREYGRLVANIVRRHRLRPFDASAVSAVMERSVRIADDSTKLSTHMRSIVDLLHEADFEAENVSAEIVAAEHVHAAIKSQIKRAGRLRDRSHETILRDIVQVSTSGETIGQVNGLSVAGFGGFTFGQPSRITARVRMGSGKVIDIEREVELGGPIHSKGVLILTGFLAARYALDLPFSLQATLVFEQSYGGIEGDSASSAELYALLSAIGEFPLRQDLAVTGSVDQHGRVQAIGAVNDKIEGFFDICNHRGLTGSQGVLIPAANVAHLMVRDDVVDAVRAGQFHIYPIRTIDDGIELLSGLPAGERGDSGKFAEGSVNDRVEGRLKEFAMARRNFAARNQENQQ